METPTEAPVVTHAKKQPWQRWTAMILILVLVAAIGGLIWQLVKVDGQRDDLQKENQELKTKVEGLTKILSETTDFEEEEAMPTKGCSGAVTEETMNTIKGALAAKNYAALSPLMADSVNVVVAASEKGGNVTSAQAVTDLDYLKSATLPWDFALPAATVADYKTGEYKAYFPDNSFIGKSANNMVVVFGFDSCAKINLIFMAVSDDLL